MLSRRLERVKGIVNSDLLTVTRPVDGRRSPMIEDEGSRSGGEGVKTVASRIRGARLTPTVSTPVLSPPRTNSVDSSEKKEEEERLERERVREERRKEREKERAKEKDDDEEEEDGDSDGDSSDSEDDSDLEDLSPRSRRKKERERARKARKKEREKRRAEYDLGTTENGSPLRDWQRNNTTLRSDYMTPSSTSSVSYGSRTSATSSSPYRSPTTATFSRTTTTLGKTSYTKPTSYTRSGSSINKKY